MALILNGLFASRNEFSLYFKILLILCYLINMSLIRSLLLAALCLAALPSDLAYVLHRSTASSRKRVLGADDIKDRSSQLRFKTFKETSKELDIEYARSLISFKLCSDSPAHDALSLIHELFERDMRTEADHLAIKCGEYSALSRLIAEGSMDGDDLDSFDSPFGYFAGALGSSSSGAEEGEHNRADEYSCNSQKFWRLSLDGIVRSLVATGNLVEACKVFSERLQKTQDGQWIPYNALDNLLLNCSEALSTVDEGTVEPQLSSSHAYMLFALENHFRSLVAGI